MIFNYELVFFFLFIYFFNKEKVLEKFSVIISDINLLFNNCKKKKKFKIYLYNVFFYIYFIFAIH